jgi:VIT1/CCC1 family predicted Fe2+/Mn2+ transporter
MKLIKPTDVAILAGMALGSYITILSDGTYLTATLGLVLGAVTMMFMNYSSKE